jgi:FAD/FMN-containing dehydrogenase
LLIGFRPVSKAKSNDDGMAFSMTGNTFIAAYGVWNDPDTDQENLAWIRKVASFIAPFTKGYYVNESDIRFSDDRPSRCFSPENWARLQTLKNKHDPEELFTYFPPTRK